MKSFILGQRVLTSEDTPYIVAEIGVNHNGSMELARTAIKAAAQSGADAVKFQTFKSDEFMANSSHPYKYVSNGKNVSESMYGMFKRLELRDEWHAELQIYAHNQGVEFLSSAADPESVDLLCSLGVPAIKIASEDIINYPLLEYAGKAKIPLILSTGMADKEEIDSAVDMVIRAGCPTLMLLHCVSVYPTPDEDAHIMRIVSLRQRYGFPVGYSDHTRGIEASIAAAALGAVLIEKHFTLDRSMEGPDHALSSDPDELHRLTAAVRKVARQRGEETLVYSRSEEKARKMFRRSIVAAVDIPKGAIIDRSMLSLKRPGTGLHPRDVDLLVRKQTRRAISQNEQITKDDVV
jgi:N,N'-diacetyllegionaminate synthase